MGWLFVCWLLLLLCRSFWFWWSPKSSCLLLFPLPLETYLERSCCGWYRRDYCLCFPLGSDGFLSHLEVIYPFWAYLCVREQSRFILLQMDVQFSHHHLFIEETVFFPLYIFFCFDEDYLPIELRVYIWASLFIPLVYVSVFMPGQCCFGDHNFVVNLEIRYAMPQFYVCFSTFL